MRKLTMLVLAVTIVLAAFFATPVLAKVVTGTNRGEWLNGSPQRDYINGLGGATASSAGAAPTYFSEALALLEALALGETFSREVEVPIQLSEARTTTTYGVTLATM
jgi:hypothetical protein